MVIKSRFLDPDISRKGKLLNNHLKDRGVYNNVAPLFSFIEFNLSGFCNRKCIFCPRSKPEVFPNVDKYLPISLYEKIMKDLGKAGFRGTILYSGFSEPLVYKDIEALIELSRQYNPRVAVELITNGDLLDVGKLIRLFKSGLKTICVSMYDGSHQLEYFQNLKKKAGLSDNQVVLRPRWLPAKEHFGITLSNRAGTIEMKDIGIKVPEAPIKQRCYYPFYQTLIDYDGRVLLCTHDWGRRLIAGDTNDCSILKIWNNDILEKVRIHLIKRNRNFSPCNLCDVDGLLMGKSHFNRWVKYYQQQ